MAEYSIKDTTLTGMADQIRTMHGTTDAMAPSTMIEKLQDANTEISEQEAALIEITEILQTKAIGTPPKLQSKTVTPSASSQTVKPDANYDGLAQVVVNGDANLVAENIAKGVTVLGISGAYEPVLQGKIVNPGANAQSITPDENYDGLYQVVVNGDENLNPANIKSDVSIFGVTGTYEGTGGMGALCPVTLSLGGGVFVVLFTTIENGTFVYTRTMVGAETTISVVPQTIMRINEGSGMYEITNVSVSDDATVLSYSSSTAYVVVNDTGCTITIEAMYTEEF